MVQCAEPINKEESVFEVNERIDDRNTRIFFSPFRDEQLITELKKVNNQLHSYRLDNDDLASTVVELRQLCGSAKERISQSEEKVTTLENRVSTAYETIEELNHKILEQELIMSSLKQEVFNLRSELTRVQFREIRLLEFLETEKNLQKLCVISDLLGNVFAHIQHTFNANKEFSSLEPFVKQTSDAVHHLSNELSNMVTLSTKKLLTNPPSTNLSVLPYDSSKPEDNTICFDIPLSNTRNSLHPLKVTTEMYDESNSSASTCCDVDTSILPSSNGITQIKKELLLSCSGETMLPDSTHCEVTELPLSKHTSILNGVASSIEKQYRMICHYRKRNVAEYNETSKENKAPLLTDTVSLNKQIKSGDDCCKPKKRNVVGGNLNDYCIKGKKIKFPKTKQYFSRRQLSSRSKCGSIS